MSDTKEQKTLLGQAIQVLSDFSKDAKSVRIIYKDGEGFTGVEVGPSKAPISICALDDLRLLLAEIASDNAACREMAQLYCEDLDDANRTIEKLRRRIQGLTRMLRYSGHGENPVKQDHPVKPGWLHRLTGIQLPARRRKVRHERA